MARRSRPAIARALEQDLAGVWRQQAEQHLGDGGLAAAGLADEAEHLALLEPERHAVDRLQRALAAQEAGAHREAARDVAHLEERLPARGGAHEAGSTAFSAQDSGDSRQR